MIDEDVLKARAPIFRVWHETMIIGANLESFSSPLILIFELSEESPWLERVLLVVVDSERPNNSFSSEDHEVSETDLVAPLSVDLLDVGLHQASLQPSIVGVLEIDAAIRAAGASTASLDLGGIHFGPLAPEVHKVVALESEQTGSIGALVLRGVLLSNNLQGELLVLVSTELLSLQHLASFGAGENL